MLEYERRLKKLIDPKANDCISEKQIIESFKDHHAFKDIGNEDSLIHALMTDEIFLKENQGYYIPYLVLMGQLYCAGNASIRAQKFFELCQIDLHPHLTHDDKEFVEYFPKMQEICYELMLKMYKKFRAEHSKMPLEEWNVSPTDLQGHYETLFKKMVDDLFGDSSKLTNDEFKKLMET